jgi:citrate synthase
LNYSPGLEGIIAGETAISNVEGDIGRLSYRGYAIEELVKLPYHCVMWLVLFGEFPSGEEQADLDAFLKAHGKLSENELQLLRQMPQDLHPMRMLQGVIPLLDIDQGFLFEDMGAEASHGLQILARMPMLIASFHHIQSGTAIPEADNSKTYLGNFLSVFTGQEVSSEHEAILAVVQILQMEHSFNVGTFTSRVVSSTLAPVDSAFSAAIGALFGVLHGGADEAALNDAKSVGCPDAAADFIDQLLERKGKLMGMGHREYRTVDPRSVILKPMAEALCLGTEHENVFRTLVALETEFNKQMKLKGKDIWANLEFYKGAVYEAIGIPSNYFTSVFAMSRMVGWLAHFIESRRDNKLVRPKAFYVGLKHRTLQSQDQE